jgi:hypothetical protein
MAEVEGLIARMATQDQDKVSGLLKDCAERLEKACSSLIGDLQVLASQREKPKRGRPKGSKNKAPASIKALMDHDRYRRIRGRVRQIHPGGVLK